MKGRICLFFLVFRVRVAATAARWATNELHTSLYILYRNLNFFIAVYKGAPAQYLHNHYPPMIIKTAGLYTMIIKTAGLCIIAPFFLWLTHIMLKQ